REIHDKTARQRPGRKRASEYGRGQSEAERAAAVEIGLGSWPAAYPSPAARWPFRFDHPARPIESADGPHKARPHCRPDPRDKWLRSPSDPTHLEWDIRVAKAVRGPGRGVA